MPLLFAYGKNRFSHNVAHFFLSSDFISGPIATNFLGLLNHKLVSSKTFSGFFFIHEYRVIKILHSNRKCAKWVEIFGGCKMDRTCTVRYVLVVNIQKDACFGLSWPLCAIFKMCNRILEIAIFKKIVKILFLQKCQLFQCGAPSFSHAHNELTIRTMLRIILYNKKHVLHNKNHALQ